MKKGLLPLVIITILLLAFTLVANATSNNSIYTTNGEVTGKIYHEDGDFTSLEITTKDGNVWIVEDCVAPLGATCKVTFDTQGTPELEDDVITSISCKIL